MSPGRTPGRGRRPRRRQQLHRRRPRQPRSEADDQPALLAREAGHASGLGGKPQLRDLDQPKHRLRHRAVAVGDLLAERGHVAGRARPGQPPVELELLGLVGHVVVGEVGVDRQVHDGLRRLPDGLAELAPRLGLLDGLGQQPRVQVEPDRRHVAGLLAAEDVAGAADLEVGERDLEPGAQLRRVEDRLEPLARLLAHPLAAAVQQVGVGAPADDRPTRPRSW